jgi:hypothetical protein
MNEACHRLSDISHIEMARRDQTRPNDVMRSVAQSGDRTEYVRHREAGLKNDWCPAFAGHDADMLPKLVVLFLLVDLRKIKRLASTARQVRYFLKASSLDASI